MLRRLLRGNENVRYRAMRLISVLPKTLIISLGLTVLFINGGVFADNITTPAGFDITVDFETAEKMGLKGVLLMRLWELGSDSGAKKRVITGDEILEELLDFTEEREIIVKEDNPVNIPRNVPPTPWFFICDFGRKQGYFIDLKPLGESVCPFAITKDRNTIFSLVTIKDDNRRDGTKAIAVMDKRGGEVRYLKFATPPASDVFFVEDEDALFFSFVDENAALEDNPRVEITAKMDAKTGGIVRITQTTEDCHFCAVAEEARLLLIGVESQDIWGAENLTVYSFAGDEIEVLLESTVMLRWPYARRLSAAGKRLLFPEWGKYIGVLCAGESDKPDLFVLEDGESVNLTQDSLIWESYDISPDGLHVGVITPEADFGYSVGPNLYVIDIDTRELFRVIDFARHTSVELIRWNK